MSRVMKLLAVPILVLVLVGVFYLYRVQEKVVAQQTINQEQIKAQFVFLQDEVKTLGQLIKPPVFKQSGVVNWGITFEQRTNVHIGPGTNYYTAESLPAKTWIGIRYVKDGWDFVTIPSLEKTGYIEDKYVIQTAKPNSVPNPTIHN